jgi:hypothetical protein
LPALAAVVTAAIVGVALWRLVAADAQAKWDMGMEAKNEMRFVFVFSLVAGGLAFAVTRRLADGPRLARTEWTLAFRDASAARVGELERRLETLGYAPGLVFLDEAGEPESNTSPSRALAGARLGVKDRRHRFAKAGLTLTMSPPGAGKGGFGIVTIVDVDPDEGFYAEMAQFLIATLAEPIPDLRFKRLNSALPADPADALRAQLPPKPARLPVA